MTEFPDEYGEILRRAMRAEADSVVPSPDGLEIIRNRIAQRGLRGVFWWRAAASAVGAVLVAASIVMVVPGLREQASPPSQVITEIGAETDAPEGQSTSRPPTGRPPEVSSTGTAVPPPPPRTDGAAPAGRPPATPASATPTPSRTPTRCPSATADGAGRASSCPGTATQRPTPTPTPSATPTEDAGCGDVECPATDDPSSPPQGETPAPEPTLSSEPVPEHGQE